MPSLIGQVASVALLRSWVRLLVGANFRPRLKKSPRLPTRQSARSLTGYGNWLRRPCVRVGQGSGGFLDLRERSSSYINAWGAACPSQAEFFYY